MKKDSLIRGIMLAAGFVAVIGILCSQTLFASNTTPKAATAQMDDKESETFIQVPSDAIPGHAVQVDDSSAFHLIATFFAAEEDHDRPEVPAKKLGQFLKVLFRTVIAPNAP